MKRILVGTLLSILLVSPAWAARSIKADVNGLVCAFCSAAIEKRLKSLAPVKAVYVDLSKKIVAVELKDGQDLSPEKMAEEIKDAGYDVVKIGRTDETIEQIRAQRANK
jgi:periplasmic mercuric ion binding protein